MEKEEQKEALVTEPVAEETAQVTEKAEATQKLYTEAEMNARVNELLGPKIARREAKIRKEYDQKYGSLEDVLRAGTGKDTVEEMTGTLRQFYEQKGVKIPEKPTYSPKEIEVLANAEADDIIRSGYDDVVEETDRLTGVGFANMTAREKTLFKKLAEYRQSVERGKALSQLGVSEDVYGSKEFSDFASKFQASTPIQEIYDLYNLKTKPKKQIQTMGSMKTDSSTDDGVKDFYTPEEARRFSKKDYDRNPALLKAVENSMLKWKR